MTIDAKNYLRSGRALAESDRPWLTSDVWHGVGMQLTTGLLFRASGKRDARVVKLFNWFCWLCLLAGWALFAWRTFHSIGWSLGLAFLLSCSIPLQRYCAVVQYEVPAALLFCLILHALITERTWARLIAGIGMGMLALFQVHFAALPFLLLISRRARATIALPVLTGFALFSVSWNLAYSSALGVPVVFKGIEDSSAQVAAAMHPLSRGFPIPAVAPVEPSGFAFVWKQPSSYLSLLARRAGYLSGLLPETWHVESGWTRLIAALGIPLNWARIGFVLAAGALFLVGLRSARDPNTLLPLLIFGPILLAWLVFNMSNRYLMPAVPSIVFFQLFAVRRIRYWRKSGRSWRFAGSDGHVCSLSGKQREKPILVPCTSDPFLPIPRRERHQHKHRRYKTLVVFHTRLKRLVHG